MDLLLSSIGKKVLILSLILGIGSRFWGLPNASNFAGDQGGDLLVAQRIVSGEFFPFVGPILNLEGFYSPPTYYLVLATLLYVFKSVEAIILVFGLLNVASAYFFYYYLREKTDKLTAFIFVVLYMFSINSIVQARSIWQPHPVSFFISLAYYCLAKAERKKESIFYLASTFFFSLGSTIYVGAMVLAPMYLLQLFSGLSSFFYKKKVALLFSVALLTLNLLLFWLPTLIFEYKNGFPTVNSIINPTFSFETSQTHFEVPLSITSLVQSVSFFAQLMLTLVFPTELIMQFTHSLWFPFTIAPILFVVIGIQKDYERIKKPFERFFGKTQLHYIVLALLPLLILKTNNSVHRVYFLLPFILMIFSSIIRTASVTKRSWFPYTAYFLLSFFIVTNIFAIYWRLGDKSEIRIQTYSEAVAVKEVLKRDAQQRNISILNVHLQMYTLDDKWSYEIQPILFLLKKELNYKTFFAPAGNDVIRGPFPSWTHKYLYLICYPIEQYSKEDCLQHFYQHPLNKDARILDSFTHGSYVIHFAEQTPKQ